MFTMAVVLRELFKSSHLILQSTRGTQLFGQALLLSIPRALASSLPSGLLVGSLLGLRWAGDLAIDRARLVRGVFLIYLAILFASLSAVLELWAAPRTEHRLKVALLSSANQLLTQEAAADVAQGVNEATIGELAQRYRDAGLEHQPPLIVQEIFRRVAAPVSCLVLGVVALAIASVSTRWKPELLLMAVTLAIHYGAVFLGEGAARAGVHPVASIVVLPNAALLLFAATLWYFRGRQNTYQEVLMASISSAADP
jgi:lipopolysaccharide export LptBFGC system permease protein LptF